MNIENLKDTIFLNSVCLIDGWYSFGLDLNTRIVMFAKKVDGMFSYTDPISIDLLKKTKNNSKYTSEKAWKRAIDACDTFIKRNEEIMLDNLRLILTETTSNRLKEGN